MPEGHATRTTGLWDTVCSHIGVRGTCLCLDHANYRACTATCDHSVVQAQTAAKGMAPQQSRSALMSKALVTTEDNTRAKGLSPTGNLEIKLACTVTQGHINA